MTPRLRTALRLGAVGSGDDVQVAVAVQVADGEGGRGGGAERRGEHSERAGPIPQVQLACLAVVSDEEVELAVLSTASERTASALPVPVNAPAEAVSRPDAGSLPLPAFRYSRFAAPSTSSTITLGLPSAVDDIADGERGRGWRTRKVAASKVNTPSLVVQVDAVGGATHTHEQVLRVAVGVEVDGQRQGAGGGAVRAGLATNLDPGVSSPTGRRSRRSDRAPFRRRPCRRCPPGVLVTSLLRPRRRRAPRWLRAGLRTELVASSTAPPVLITSRKLPCSCALRGSRRPPCRRARPRGCLSSAAVPVPSGSGAQQEDP